MDLAGAEDDVQLTLPPDTHPVRTSGIRARRAALHPAWVCTHRGVRVTDPEATAVALAGGLPLDDAVVAIDRMTVSGLAALPLVRARASVATGRGCGWRVVFVTAGDLHRPEQIVTRIGAALAR